MAKVIEVKDNIITLQSEPNENYLQSEIIIFSKTTYGMLLSATTDRVFVALLAEGKDKIKPGMTAMQTGTPFRISLSNDMIGKIFDYAGTEYKIPELLEEQIRSKIHPIFKFPVNSSNLENLSIDPPGTTISSRISVNTTLETGILGVDSMLALGMGQRELIIGDRQTGKTSIAIDTIINQKGKNVICIYNLIGKKNSDIIEIYNYLYKKGALDYTIIMASPASDIAIKNYLSPYVATTVAEAYKNHNQNVLIVYDDLSKHAKAYRSISLLIGSNPGREAYPGDIFYVHAKLLERSGNFTQFFGGGSITSLPIAETQKGFSTDYISTNLISITDGQLITSEFLFKDGQRPAIDINISVSRVGGKAQSIYLRNESGQLKNLYSQYSIIKKNFIEKEALSHEKQEIYVQGQILNELLKQNVGETVDYVFEWILVLLLNEKAFYNFEIDDIAYVKKHLLKFSIQNKMARNYLLFVQNHFKSALNTAYDKTLIHYYVRQIFFPFMKWLGTTMYRKDKYLVAKFSSQFLGFPNFYYDVKLDAVQDYRALINTILKDKVVRKTNRFTKDLNIE